MSKDIINEIDDVIRVTKLFPQIVELLVACKTEISTLQEQVKESHKLNSNRLADDMIMCIMRDERDLERKLRIETYAYSQTLIANIEQTINEAILAEREACAKLCEHLGYVENESSVFINYEYNECRDAIRARAK